MNIPSDSSEVWHLPRRGKPTERSEKQKLLESKADELAETAQHTGITLRLLGGVAFKMLSPSARDLNSDYYRENEDADGYGLGKERKKTMEMMVSLGYKPREDFNKLHATSMLIYDYFLNPDDKSPIFRVDIVLDKFVMCHPFDFRGDFLPGTKTLPITQLLMTKLQVVEKTEKEYLDSYAALRDFPVFDGVSCQIPVTDVARRQTTIISDEIAEAAAGNRGVYNTFMQSFEDLIAMSYGLNDSDYSIVVPKIRALKDSTAQKPKPLSFRLSARLGIGGGHELPDPISNKVRKS